MVFVVARLRTKYRAALAPQRISNFTHTRAAGSLLTPRFLTASLNFGASFCFVRTGTMAGQILLHGLMHEVFVNRATKDRVCQVEFPDHFVFQILYVNRSHFY